MELSENNFKFTVGKWSYHFRYLMDGYERMNAYTLEHTQDEAT